jgi:hypothetical protein
MVDFKRELEKKRRLPRLDLNPSSAERWTTCTASPKFIFDNWDRIPKDDSTKYNTEGTTAHEVAAAFLEDREPDFKNTYKCPVPITKEMRRHGFAYMEYVRDLVKPGGKVMVEQKLPLWYMPERNAMIDVGVINPDSIHVVDYKYGAGVVVSPENNLQGAIYLQSLLFKLKISAPPPLTIHIYQPRGRASEDGGSHIWKVDIDVYLKLIGQVTLAASAILNGGPDLVFAPSPKACQWCPAKGFCVARKEAFTKDVKTLEVIPAGEKHLPPVKAVSVAQLAAILKHKPAIIKWLEDAEEYALQHLSAGGTIPGYKLVTSRGGNRYWTNPAKAAKMLLENTHLRREEVIEEKVIGPGAAETLLGKNKFNVALTELIARNPGKPTIAPEDDPRESCLIDPSTEFEKL